MTPALSVATEPSPSAPGVAATRQPKVSVVIASGAGGKFLFRCLAALQPQLDRHDSQVVVVDRTGDATRRRIAREYARALVIAAPAEPRPTVPHMRRMGVEAATGEIVVILEEHCRPSAGWLDAIVANVAPGDAAIGGPILDDAYDRTTDWCVYFSEYHNYLPPWENGDRFALNGANIAYNRSLVMKYRDALDEGYWEVVLHPQLVRDGRLRAVNAMGVHHTGPFRYGYYLRQRYLLSRVWGGTQRAVVPASSRLVHLALGPVFPLLLFGRVTSRVLARPQFIGKYAAALPLLVPAWFCYAAGEWLGYLLGPGRALQEVE
jgi:glycosyltransferase involved in cell wall biosynthesis